jgi:hypothetical protein
MSLRTWQITADVIFPNHFSAETDDQRKPRLPKQLKPKSRIPIGHCEIDGTNVFIYEGDRNEPAILNPSHGNVLRRGLRSGCPRSRLQHCGEPLLGEARQADNPCRRRPRSVRQRNIRRELAHVKRHGFLLARRMSRGIEEHGPLSNGNDQSQRSKER